MGQQSVKQLNMKSIFKDGIKNCCIFCNKKEWNRSSLDKHLKYKNSWYHIACNTFLHSLYDDFNEESFLFEHGYISSETTCFLNNDNNMTQDVTR